jgi:poly-gamma-glutamate capsule biosynthesis protein CapA/YwtB (metallophosphatase superfamily)
VVYEAEARDLRLVAAGDAILVRPLRMFREPEFLAMVDVVRGADVAFVNPEILFHRYEMPAASVWHVAYAVAPPGILEELKWLGFNLLCDAHTHAWDYGVDGLLTTLRHIEEAELAHAGAGMNLAEARAPGYLETAKGRVALLSCLTSFQPAACAGEQRPDHLGRPGISFLRHKKIYTVPEDAFRMVRLMSERLGEEEEKKHEREMGPFFSLAPLPPDTDTEFHFKGQHFRLGDEFGVTSVPDAGDVADILRWVREARRQADWVLMSVHSHEYGNGEAGKGLEDPPDFLETFARQCIDEGVDVFLGHGPHFIRGMELYEGKPIFYGLGDFAFQNQVYPKLPADSYARFGLDHDSTPADVYDAKAQVDNPDFQVDVIYWQGLLPEVTFRNGALEAVTLHIVDQQRDQPRSRHGRPTLSGIEAATKALERVARLSNRYNTHLDITNGVGRVRLASVAASR